VRAEIGRIPPDRRRIVTGHESLGYYADRYGLRLVGAVLPGLSSQAEASAARLAELREAIEREEVPAVFTETGFPPELAGTVARETGVPVIEVATETVPEGESYAAFIEAATDAFVRGLAPGAVP
jgi:zinc/manganese transport system substrate-binding protein